MGKNEKELEQISTTDKLKAFKTLKEAGYKVELNGSGVPTVICQKPEDIDKELKNVRKVLKELRYSGSFGVRAVRKTDMIATDETEERTEATEQISA